MYVCLWNTTTHTKQIRAVAVYVCAWVNACVCVCMWFSDADDRSFRFFYLMFDMLYDTIDMS